MARNRRTRVYPVARDQIETELREHDEEIQEYIDEANAMMGDGDDGFEPARWLSESDVELLEGFCEEVLKDIGTTTELAELLNLEWPSTTDKSLQYRLDRCLQQIRDRRDALMLLSVSCDPVQV